jgi:hypothetical protein
MTYYEMLHNLMDPRSFFTLLSGVTLILLVSVIIGTEVSAWIRKENRAYNETTTKGPK